MGAPKNSFKVGSQTFRLNSKESHAWIGGQKVKVSDFCTAEKFKKQREAYSQNQTVCTEIVGATVEGPTQAKFDAVVKELKQLKATIKKGGTK